MEKFRYEGKSFCTAWKSYIISGKEVVAHITVMKTKQLNFFKHKLGTNAFLHQFPSHPMASCLQRTQLRLPVNTS